AAKDSEQLSKDVEEQAHSSEAQNDQQNLEQAAEELRKKAAEPQHQAAQSAQGGQSGSAKMNGQQASQGLQSAADMLRKMAQENQQQQDSVDLAALRRAAQDLVSLQRESEANLEPGLQNDERANQQTDLSEGVTRVSDSLGVLAKKTPFL